MLTTLIAVCLFTAGPLDSELSAAQAAQRRGDHPGALLILGPKDMDSDSRAFDAWLKSTRVMHGIYGLSNRTSLLTPGFRTGALTVWPRLGAALLYPTNVNLDAQHEIPLAAPQLALVPHLAMDSRSGALWSWVDVSGALPSVYVDDESSTRDWYRVNGRGRFGVGSETIRFRVHGDVTQQDQLGSDLDAPELLLGQYGAELVWQPRGTQLRLGYARRHRILGDDLPGTWAAHEIGLSLAHALPHRLAILGDAEFRSRSLDPTVPLLGDGPEAFSVRAGLVWSQERFELSLIPGFLYLSGVGAIDNVFTVKAEASYVAPSIRLSAGFSRGGREEALGPHVISDTAYLRGWLRLADIDVTLAAAFGLEKYASFDPSTADFTVNQLEREDAVGQVSLVLGYSIHRTVRVALMYRLDAVLSNYQIASSPILAGEISDGLDSAEYVAHTPGLLVEVRY